MQKQVNYIEDLSPLDLSHLASLLSYTPTPTPTPTPISPCTPFPPPSFLASQSAILTNTSTTTESAFPPHLLRSTALLPRLALKLSPHLPFAAAKATLCSAHRPLNPFLIRRIFMQICAEAGLRVSGLVASYDNIQSGDSGGDEREDKNERDTRETAAPAFQRREKEPEIDPLVKTWLRRLRSLNSLWLFPALYRVLTGAQPHEARFSRVDGGCEACILAVIGGSATAICDLRAGMLGRKKSGRESRLWGLVEAWTVVVGSKSASDGGGGGWGGGNEEGEDQEGEGEGVKTADWIREESGRVGRLVMKERKRIRRAKRRERRERRDKWQKTGSNKISDTKDDRRTEKTNISSSGDDAAVAAEDCFDDEYKLEEEIGDMAPTVNRIQTQKHQSNREAQDHDFEGSIINFYRDVVSQRWSHLALHNPYSEYNNDRYRARVDNVDNGDGEEDALHPAFRNSVVYSLTSGTFHRRPKEQSQQPLLPQRCTSQPNQRAQVADDSYNIGTGSRDQRTTSRLTYYTQSTYSQDDGSGNILGQSIHNCRCDYCRTNPSSSSFSSTALPAHHLMAAGIPPVPPLPSLNPFLTPGSCPSPSPSPPPPRHEPGHDTTRCEEEVTQARTREEEQELRGAIEADEEEEEARRVAERRAQSYRDLVGVLVPLEEELGKGVQGGGGRGGGDSGRVKQMPRVGRSSSPLAAPPPPTGGDGYREYMRKLWMVGGEPVVEDDACVVVSGEYSSDNAAAAAAAANNVEVDLYLRPDIYNPDPHSAVDDTRTAGPYSAADDLSKATTDPQRSEQGANHITKHNHNSNDDDDDDDNDDNDDNAATAYANSNNTTQQQQQQKTNREAQRERHLTTWSDMLRKGGANQWLGA